MMSRVLNGLLILSFVANVVMYCEAFKVRQAERACLVELSNVEATIKVTQILNQKQIEKLKLVETISKQDKLKFDQDLQALRSAKISKTCEEAIKYGLKHL